MHVRRDREQ
jgi:hypothetical protein